MKNTGDTINSVFLIAFIVSIIALVIVICNEDTNDYKHEVSVTYFNGDIDTLTLYTDGVDRLYFGGNGQLSNWRGERVYGVRSYTTIKKTRTN